MMKDQKNVKRGKKSRASGKAFELIVRKDLESQGFIVLRNSNDVINNNFVQSKAKWNPFTKRPMMLHSGWPDYICFRNHICWNCLNHGLLKSNCGFQIKFVECKKAKYLDANEKLKREWIKKNLNAEVWVAFMNKEKKIEYVRV